MLVGRLIAFLESLGELDNTIIMFSIRQRWYLGRRTSGTFYNKRRMNAARPPARQGAGTDRVARRAASEALYPTGWGQMCNTPFPTYKTYTGGGGRRVTYIISWRRCRIEADPRAIHPCH